MTDLRCDAVAYDPPSSALLDVWRAADAKDRPVVVFFHGGGWRSCGRGDAFHTPVLRALAQAGMVVVAPDYRLYPDVSFPAFVDDAARATAWAHQHAAAWGGDPRRLIVAGYSAGAHIAALLAYDRGYLARCKSDAAILGGMAGLSGYYDFDATDDPFISKIFSIESLAGPAQPAAHVRPDAPPSLLVHGLKDVIARPEQSDRLEAALRRVGAPAAVIRLPDDDHHSYMTKLHAAPAHSPVLTAILALATSGAPPETAVTTQREDER